jgi:uncharacterized membrane protein
MRVFLFWFVLRRLIRWGFAGALWLTALVLPPHAGDAAARSGGGHHGSEYCASCSRDAHGHIARSREATDAFKRMTGYPHGRPGYVIDHVVALCKGGADAPYNMAWQTVAEAKAKDKWECK